MNPYYSACDEFGLYLYLHTKLDLPNSAETVLHFFDTLNKRYPELTDLEQRETGEFILEEDNDNETHKAIVLDKRKVVSMIDNPQSIKEADELHERVLELSPYHLNVGSLNCESIELVFSFDYLYQGNHDEVIADALASGTPFEGLLNYAGGKALHFEPALVVALDPKCRLQARVWVESRTNAAQVATGFFPESPLSVYLAVTQIWGRLGNKTFFEVYRELRAMAQEFAETFILPQILKPLRQSIGQI